MIGEGWVVLYRRLLDSGIWKEEPPQTVLLFIYLILIANHADNPFGKIVIRKGQRLTNVPELMKALNNWFTYDQIDNALANLEKRGAITKVRSGSRKSLITICNYDKWQNRTEIKNQPNVKRNKKNDESSYSQGIDVKDTIKITEHNAEQKLKKSDTKNNNELFNNNENNNTYTIEQQFLFSKFQNWIQLNAPTVSKMKEPFTIEQYLKLKQRAGTERLYCIVEDMENYVALKNYKSAYSTFLNFFKRQGGKDSKLFSVPKLPTEEVKELQKEAWLSKKMII